MTKGMRYRNSDLWSLAELLIIKKGSLFEDHEGNVLIFTGKSFQVYYTEKDLDNEYVGMCVNDLWTFIGTEEDYISYH